MPSEHAKLSASGSKRWLACPGSIVLEALYPDASTVYAEEGTRAHVLAEITLKHLVLGSIVASDVAEARAKADNDEMRQAVDEYVAYCKDLYDSMVVKYKSPTAFLEERVSYDKWVPGGFGTIDFIVQGGAELHIVDLKYGKGVAVDAVDNPQPRLYALGAINEYGDLYSFKQITVHIVQPRLDSISREEFTVDELLAWGESIKAQAQLAFNDTRQYQVGEHCGFCKAKAACKARAAQTLGAVAKVLGGNEVKDGLTAPAVTDPDLLGHDEIEALLPYMGGLKDFLKTFEELALGNALRGEKYEGFKVVEGRSNRKYTDEDAVASTLKASGYEEAVIYERKLLGISDMEKMVGKKRFTTILSDLVIKPPGKPALVPESDSRPEYSLTPNDSAAADFED